MPISFSRSFNKITVLGSLILIGMVVSSPYAKIPPNLSPEEKRQLLEQFQGLAPDQKQAALRELKSPQNPKEKQLSQKLPDEMKSAEVEQEEALEKKEEKPITQDESAFVKTPFNIGWAPQTEQEPELNKQVLKLFGYDLFSQKPSSTFASLTQAPVLSEYILGPGDTVKVQLFGKENITYELMVDREGNIDFPGIGPITVAGLRFDEFKALLQVRISKQLIGINASITMGELRSIQIFVMGEAKNPGSYTVGGLTTLTNALLVSGGILPTGSLRTIALKRNGKVVQTLDLYDLLLKGDTRADKRLLPGDVVFIPPVEKRVGIGGEVLRPAIYEIKEEKTVKELITLAGGFLPTSYPQSSHIERINSNGERTLQDINLTEPKNLQTRLQDGDIVRIFPILEKVEKAVYVKGHVWRAGGFAWREGISVTDLVKSLDELRPKPDLNYALVKRTLPITQEIKILAVNLGEALKHPKKEADIILLPKDEFFVFGMEEGRNKIIKSIVEALRSQAKKGEPEKIVRVTGHVRYPGEYPLEENMSSERLLIAAGGLIESAFGLKSEITRYQVVDEQSREVQHVPVSLWGNSDTSKTEEVLQPHDVLHVQRLPNWEEREYVTLIGEGLRFPGEYTIRRDETLNQVIERAGGLTKEAYAEAAIFTREDLRKVEEQRLLEIKERVKSEIATETIQVAAEKEGESEQASLQEKNKLLEKLEGIAPLGRLVIELNRILKDSKTYDVKLRGGDQLLVPRFRQEVSVMGEVQSPIAHLYDHSLTVDEYIERSGGFTQKADEDRVYVLKANGAMANPRRMAWFRIDETIAPGDTIVVPMDVDHINPLELWTKVTQILYQSAITIAALTNLVK